MADLLKTFFRAARLAKKQQRKSTATAFKLLQLPAASKPKPKTKRKSPARPRASSPRAARVSTARPPRPEPGSFVSGEFTCPQGTRDYKLYTPKGSGARRMPLVVMMHGCGQSVGDFASGTDMNRVADELGVLVLYPQQSKTANIGRCWNWHDGDHQHRGRGEPAIIAAMTLHAIALGRANPARVYIAGISAGGSAAAIIGAAYPDLFVAVGVHSGVAVGHIGSLAGALTAMRGKTRRKPVGKLPAQLPTIVFHGDHDRVVHPSNTAGFLNNLERSRPGPVVSQTAGGRSKGGRDYTRTIYKTGPAGATAIVLEDWTVHGGGHAWAGGRASGSHTDPSGPDASREMLRFFLSRRRAG